MMAFKTILAGGLAAAALVSAAPASAQYYPGYGGGYGGYGSYGGGYGSSGGVLGAVVNSVLGGGGNYGGYGYNGYNANSQVSVQRCAAAVQQRLGGYGGGGGYGGYGYNSYNSGGRILSITSVEPRPNGSFKVKGLASSSGYNQPDLTFGCKVDYRGYISDLNVDRNNSYGYNGYGYGNGYNNGYSSPYGYRRY